MSSILRKTAIMGLAVLCMTYLPYLLLGLWNRVFGGWRSVFFCYAGNASYRQAYAPGKLASALLWWPVTIGVLSQGGARGLVMASAVTEQDFLDPANAKRLDRLVRRLHRIARIIGAPQVNLAGILPSVLHARGLPAPAEGREITARLVLTAAETLVRDRFDGIWPPVIVLGGAGFIGQAVVSELQAAGRRVHVVDPKKGGAQSLPVALSGYPALLIDAARAGAIDSYVAQFWPGLVVLNEAFPEPRRAVRTAMAEQGAQLWHLSGAVGRIWPDLPGAYGGAVPCCAVHHATLQLEPVLRKMNDAPPAPVLAEPAGETLRAS